MNHGATVPPQKDKCASDKQHVLHENGMVYAFQIFFFFLMDNLFFTCTLAEKYQDNLLLSTGLIM